ncbi:MAG: tetratricopeptide repeat protein [Gemmataceae bacterium]
MANDGPDPRPRRWRWALAGLALAAAGWFAWPHALAAWSLRQARRAIDERRFDQAYDRLAACLRAWPNDPETRLLASRAARQSGRAAEAREHLDAVPDDAEHRAARVLERALLEASEGQLPKVESFLRRQLEAEPDQAPAILDVLSWQGMRAHRLLDARADLDRWRELRPGDAEPLVRRGWVAERLLDNDGAARDYRAALELDPSRDQVRQRLGEVLLGRDSAEALKQFEALARHKPDDPEVLLGMARARLNLAELDAADELLDRLLRASPDHAGAMAERGRLELARRHPEEAERWLRKALARSPHDRETTHRLLRALQAQGKAAEVAQVREGLDRLDADLARMNKLMPQVNERPNDPALRTEIGKIFLRNGLESDGVRWLNTALEYAPTFAEAHEALAGHFESRGNKGQAARHRKALARAKAGG